MGKRLLFLVIILFIMFTLFSCNKKSPTENEPPTTVTDIDGNVYQVVKIGKKYWMAENLKVTHYRNGDPIVCIKGEREWCYSDTGAYCYYNNNGNNAEIYGCLYNWYAINDSRKIAPKGWRVMNCWDRDLIDYLGGESVAGGKMKETGTTYWASPNTGATNERGFSALPGGYRDGSNGMCTGMDSLAYFWFHCCELKSTYSGITCDCYYCGFISYDSPWIHLYRTYRENYGYSVRCVWDDSLII